MRHADIVRALDALMFVAFVVAVLATVVLFSLEMMR